MTRKEQIKAILDEYAIFKGYYVKDGVGAERIYSGELADRIAALPIDVPGDNEISKPLTPHTCPVCNGNGLVANGFYTQTSGVWSTTSIAPEICRSCNGFGIVWG